MRVGRTSIGSRIVSVLLAACMIFGMVPLSAFAVESATAGNLETIRDYAAGLLADSFADAGTNNDLSWTTETDKGDNWRYYTGVMLDAMLMLGVDSDTNDGLSTNSALEFAQIYMDFNISDSGSINEWHDGELDSVPPALTLLTILDSAGVDAAHREDYENAIHFVYNELADQTAYTACGGNFLHKQDSNGEPTSSWSEYEIGLDGIYMAQPFLMAYANALADGCITNNSVKPETIYRAVHDRLMWVADNMYDSATKLYHHGWDATNSKGNGHFWSRGIGWYAAGLVMCIDRMPEGSYKTDLIGKLPKLFDGMLDYQHSSGLWYNVVNLDDNLTDNNGNKLETSGTALMAYAMMKAYNNGWVGASYATAAEKAFNGIVSNKLVDGKITDTYKSSGVCTSDADYCKNSYVSDEAKGVGPVIMAASEIAKYLGGTETFTTGVVAAPDITTSVGVAPDYSHVKITVVGSNGTVKNVPYTEVTFAEVAPAAVEDAAGDVTVYAIYDNSVIDTFTVSVVDTESSKSDTGTVGIPTADPDVDTSAGTATSDGWVTVSTGSGSSDGGDKYQKATTVAEGTYVIGASSGQRVLSYSNPGTTIAASWTPDGDYYTTTASVETWILEAYDAANNQYYLKAGDGSGYLVYDGDRYPSVSTSKTDGVWTVTVSSGNFVISNSSNSSYPYLNVQSSAGIKMESSSKNLWLMGLVPSGETLYASMTAGSGYAYETGTTTVDNIISAIKTDYANAISVSTNADGSNPTTVAWDSTDYKVTYDWDTTPDVNTTTTTTYNLRVYVDGKKVGSIPVKIYSNMTNVDYSVTLTVTPENLVIEAGKTASYTAEATVSGIDGYTANITVTIPDASVATADYNVITGVAGGTTSIVVSVNSISKDGVSYELSEPAQVTLNIIVNEPAEEEPHIHDYTAVENPVADCTTAGTRTYTCSCGDSYTETVAALGHNYVDGTCTRCGEEDADYSEPTTEATTVATEPPASGGTTVIYNATTGALASGATVSGSTTTSHGSSYSVDGVSLTQGLNVDGGSLTYVATASGTLTIYVAARATGRSVKVTEDGTNIATHTYESANTLESFTVDVTAGKTYVITKNSSGSGLYYVTLTTSDDSHTHSYTSSVTTAATCTTAGVRTYTCSCGDSYTEEIAALGHNYGAGVETKAPTCTETGVMTYTCQNDASHTYTESIPATGHTYVDGTCSSCGAAQPTGGSIYTHNFTADGTTSSFYTINMGGSSSLTENHGTGYSYDTLTLNKALKLDSSANISFTTEGAGTVTFCAASKTAGATLTFAGETYTLEEANTLYTFTVDVTADTAYTLRRNETESGLYYISYAESGSGSGDHTHSYTASVTTEATCTTAGVRTYTCSCGDSYTEEIAALGHNWNSGVETKAPTCTETGVMTYTCQNDASHTYTETIPATGHTYVDGTCSSCGAEEPVSVGNEYVIATEMVNGNQYLFSNKSNVDRAAYWDGDSWATGTISRTAVSGKENTYTIESSTGFTLFTWESTGTNTGYFYSMVNGSKVYLNDDGKMQAASTSDATLFTVDLANGIVKGDNGKWLKVDSSALNYKTSEEKSMLLYTPTSGGTTPDPDEPDTPVVSSEKYIHNFTEHGFTDVDNFFTIVGSEKTDVNTITYNGMSLSKALKMNSSAKVTFTADANGNLILVFADGANNIDVVVNGTETRYTRDDNNTVTVTDIPAGAEVEINYGSGEGRLYYVEFVPTGAVTAYPTDATVSPATVNVANSGTIDLTGVTMEVTMSDGSTKTVQNSSLTYDVSGINTAIAGTYTVPVSYTEGGKTVSADVSIVVAAASSGGGTTTSDLWKHNFDEDGLTDEDGFFTISGNVKTGISGSYGDLTFDKGMKIESSTKLSFTAPKDGTLTLVMDTANKDVKVNGTSYTTDSNGVVTVNVSAGSVEISKDDSMNIFYMEYAAAVTDGIQIEAPGTLYIAGSTTNLNPVHELHYSIMHNDAAVTEGYTIEWSALDSTVVSVASDGTVTGLKPGTTSVTALVTMEDGTEYTATVPVTVAGPSVNATEEMALIFGEEGQNAEGISATVLAGGTIVSAGNFTLGYVSTDETVATVHPTSGMVTAVGPGTATIYTYIISVNGHTVYEGDGKNPQPAYFDSTAVTVTKREVSSAYLNTYDFVIQKAATADDAAKLIDALTYVSSITGPNGVTAEEGLVLTVEFNTGDKRELHYGDDGLTVDYSNIDFSKPGVQTALVKYVDPATGEELFLDTIWVHIEDFDPAGYDGVITYEDGIHYVLDTDGVNLNEEYIIVAGNGEVALMNPNPTATGSTGAGSAAVTLANGVLSSKIGSGTLFDGAAVDYLTMAESDAQQAAWLLDTGVQSVTGPDGVTRLQVNASNLNRYLGLDESETQLIHSNAAHIYLETVSEIDGEYRIVVGFRNNVPYYLDYVDGVWTATAEPASLYLYNKHVEMTQDYGVKYTVTPNSISIPEGFVSDPVIPSVIYNVDTQVSAEDYTIVWTSSNPSVATVDQNGKITGITPGTAVIEATLYDVYGMAVICTTHNVPYVTKVVQVEVTESDPTPVLTPSTLTIGKGTMPNFSKVAVRMTFPGADESYNYDVPFDQLNFKLVEATGEATDGTAMDHFDNTVTGTYQVPVEYAGQTFTLTIHVVEDPYAGLEEADSIPGFPDAGSVRMNKTATGVLDFSQTGVTKLELTAAGVSTKNSVDVVLIVDVSNSMGWSMDWFVGKTADQVDSADDYDKGPAGGAAGTDKLDLAMATADKFADILLNVEGGDNTLTFVTFAGADRDHGGSSDHVDSVRTPMVGIDQYSIASQVFADTKFTDVRYLDADGKDAGSYKLTIGGYSDDGYGEASVSGSNRGNTNYDFAFGEAIDAVAQLKAKWEANNEGTYEESGRQIHVVFMTDGAPSHYNSKNANGSSDTLWSGSGKYSKPDGVSESSWLTYIENYNELATSLAGNVDSLYTIGFDMAHGGFSTYSYELGEMERVLQGLVKNTVVPVELAENEEELDSYLTTLARALAYAGTNARVTDVIGGNFSLFTGTSMYSSDITAGGIMSAETLAQMQAMSFPITINSYTLVTAADIGKTLSVIMGDGTPATVTVAEEHLGLRVDEEPKTLEQITFSADGTEAYSSLKSGNIMYIDGEGRRVIDAETFTYTATLDTMVHEGVEISHAKDETIVWKIGTITDKEVAMEYYAYLDGALDNPREAVAGVYATNEYAYAEYVDAYGKYVKRYYGVPQIAWGAGSVTVRFYLVNAQGQFVNHANVPFTNPANRIFLDGRAHYEVELNNGMKITALDALAQAGLAGTNILYDVTAAATVTNSTTEGQGGIVWEKNSSLNNINNLLISTDSSNGFYTSVVLDIPVVMTELKTSLRPMADTTVVIDYGKPMDINVFSQEEMPYVAGYPDVRNPDQDGTKYWYTMEVMGFATYSAAHDLRAYVDAQNVRLTTLGDEATYFAGTYGKFVVTSENGATQVRYIPTTIVKGVESVFVAIRFQEYKYNSETSTVGAATDSYYIMYKQLNILPATVTYYETDGNVNPAFTLSGSGWTHLSGGNKGGDIQDIYTQGSEIYGYDSSYNGNTTMSNGSAYKAEGVAAGQDGKFPVNAKFTFTGTGFDIISRTGANEGTIRVTYTNKATGASQSVSVINKGQLELHQIPVVSVEGLTYGTYEVLIEVYNGFSFNGNVVMGNEFIFDAVRIYGTLTGSEKIQTGEVEGGEYTTSTYTTGSIYAADSEKDPYFTEVRDILISSDSFSSTGSVSGAMYIDDFSGTVDVSNYNTYGANNEVYLKNGNAVAFTFTLSDAMKSFDLGMKSVDGGDVNATVAILPENASEYESYAISVSGSSAQFYDLLAKTGYDLASGTKVHVVISNVSGGILSLTDLKVAGAEAIVTSDTQTLMAARYMLDDGNDIYAVSFAETTVRVATTVTLTVTTSADVDDLVITNCYGEEVWFSAVEISEGVWTVKLRPTLLGEQTFTVTAVSEGVQGSSLDALVTVELY